MFPRACPQFGDRAPLVLFDENDFGVRAERVPRNLGPSSAQQAGQKCMVGMAAIAIGKHSRSFAPTMVQ
jgi:hypothetical protein